MSGPQVFADIEQGSEEWLAIRAGLPTASCFHVVSAKPGPRGGTSHPEYRGRRTYLYKLAGERITGEPMDNYVGYDMLRGKEREDEARKLYGFLNDVKPQQIGFVKNGNCGASPDSLIGDDGLLEIKDALPHIQIERLLDGTIPNEHKAQCRGQLLVTGREWVDFMSHCRGLPPLIVRMHRKDEEKEIDSLRADIDRFVDELDKLVEFVKAMDI